MTEIPNWWLILSGVFFVFNIIAFFALTFALLRIGQQVNEIKPRIEEVAKKVEAAAQRVEEVAAAAQATITDVGGKARGAVVAAEGVVGVANSVIARFSPVISGVMTAVRIFKAVQGLRGSKSHSKAEEVKALPNKGAKGVASAGRKR